MVILSRHASQESKSKVFSAWMLIPAVQRFNRAYLQLETENLFDFLKQRFSFLETKVISAPKELSGTSRESGPPLHCLYKEGVTQQNILARWNRFFQLGPESQRQQGPNGSFLREIEVEKSIVKWWLKEQDLLKKREARMKQGRNKDEKL